MPIAPTRPKFFYGYVVVTAALFMSIVMWGARVSFGVFFEPVLNEFGWTRAATSGGFSLTWVFTGLLSIAVGKLNDKWGPRLIMTVAGVLVGLGYLLMSRLSSIWQLYLFYGVVSVGMSAVLVPTLSTVARWFFKMRAFMTGIVLAGTSISLMAILPFANRAISNHGWRIAYVIVGSVVIVVVVIAAQFLRRDPNQVGKLPYGYDGTGADASDVETNGLSFREALRTHQVWLISLIYFCTFFIFYVLLVHLIIYATGQGISSARAVRIMAFLGGAGIAGRTLMGIFADRIGNKQAMMLSAGLMMLALFWLLVAKDIWMLFLFGAAFGFGHGGMATMESPMVANVFGLRSHGVILGLVFLCDTVGGATGPFLAGYAFDVSHSYNQSFLLCAILSVISLVAILFLKPLKNLGKSA
jgi:MFS transporter, OFA family, oxalate/formate antiporter